LQCNAIVGSALVNMHTKCGYIENAQVFHKVPEQNVVSWNVMILGYVEDGNVEEAMKFFLQMVSWTAILDGYVHKGYLDKAMEIFLQMPKKIPHS